MRLHKLSQLFLFAGLLVFFSACSEDADQTLKDIIKEDLGYVPVIASFNLASPTAEQVQAGTTLTFDLRYWSEVDISEIELYSAVGEAEPVLLQTFPYEPAYSEVSRTDSLIINYQLPATLEAGTSIRFDAVVVNENENTKTRSTTLTLN